MQILSILPRFARSTTRLYAKAQYQLDHKGTHLLPCNKSKIGFSASDADIPTHKINEDKIS